MTPCEKLGYKVGDRFEVIGHHSFKKGDVVTLREDDGSECPAFTGENGSLVTKGVTWSFARLSDLNPVKPSKLTKSKQALANAIHASGKGWPDGANWAVQVSRPPEIFFASGQEKPVRSGNGYRVKSGGLFQLDSAIKCDSLLPNWHQTVLSRDEYFSAYPEVVEPVFVGVDMASGADSTATLTVNAKPTIEQLASDYRNKLDFSNRKQQEADDAKAASDAALGELVAAGEALGLLIAAAKPEPELVITGWWDLRPGDEIECTEYDAEHRFGVVCRIDGSTGEQPIMVDHGEGKGISWPSSWRFIRRP